MEQRALNCSVRVLLVYEYTRWQRVSTICCSACTVAWCQRLLLYLESPPVCDRPNRRRQTHWSRAIISVHIMYVAVLQLITVCYVKPAVFTIITGIFLGKKLIETYQKYGTDVTSSSGNLKKKKIWGTCFSSLCVCVGVCGCVCLFYLSGFLHLSFMCTVREEIRCQL